MYDICVYACTEGGELFSARLMMHMFNESGYLGRKRKRRRKKKKKKVGRLRGKKKKKWMEWMVEKLLVDPKVFCLIYF